MLVCLCWLLSFLCYFNLLWSWIKWAPWQCPPDSWSLSNFCLPARCRSGWGGLPPGKWSAALMTEKHVLAHCIMRKESVQTVTHKRAKWLAKSHQERDKASCGQGSFDCSQCKLSDAIRSSSKLDHSHFTVSSSFCSITLLQLLPARVTPSSVPNIRTLWLVHDGNKTFWMLQNLCTNLQSNCGLICVNRQRKSGNYKIFWMTFTPHSPAPP